MLVLQLLIQFSGVISCEEATIRLYNISSGLQYQRGMDHPVQRSLQMLHSGVVSMGSRTYSHESSISLGKTLYNLWSIKKATAALSSSLLPMKQVGLRGGLSILFCLIGQGDGVVVFMTCVKCSSRLTRTKQLPNYTCTRNDSKQ